jgi:hypothetical protein
VTSSGPAGNFRQDGTQLELIEYHAAPAGIFSLNSESHKASSRSARVFTSGPRDLPWHTASWRRSLRHSPVPRFRQRISRAAGTTFLIKASSFIQASHHQRFVSGHAFRRATAAPIKSGFSRCGGILNLTSRHPEAPAFLPAGRGISPGTQRRGADRSATAPPVPRFRPPARLSTSDQH